MCKCGTKTQIRFEPSLHKIDQCKISPFVIASDDVVEILQGLVTLFGVLLDRGKAFRSKTFRLRSYAS